MNLNKDFESHNIFLQVNISIYLIIFNNNNLIIILINSHKNYEVMTESILQVTVIVSLIVCFFANFIFHSNYKEIYDSPNLSFLALIKLKHS